MAGILPLTLSATLTFAVSGTADAATSAAEELLTSAWIGDMQTDHVLGTVHFKVHYPSLPHCWLELDFLRAPDIPTKSINPKNEIRGPDPN